MDRCRVCKNMLSHKRGFNYTICEKCENKKSVDTNKFIDVEDSIMDDDPADDLYWSGKD